MKKCSEINPVQAKNLFKTNVTLEEVSSSKTIKAFVVDYCFDDQSGFIVRVLKKDIEELDSIEFFMDSDDGKEFKEIDLRDIFYGDLFKLIPIH